MWEVVPSRDEVRTYRHECVVRKPRTARTGASIRVLWPQLVIFIILFQTLVAVFRHGRHRTPRLISHAAVVGLHGGLSPRNWLFIQAMFSRGSRSAEVV